MNKVELLLKELRDAADIMFNIFTKGSCFRLFSILKIVYPKAESYWSDVDNHAVTKINDSYYDIGGILNKEYIEEKGYYKVTGRFYDGYHLLKYNRDKEQAGVALTPEKYKIN